MPNEKWSDYLYSRLTYYQVMELAMYIIDIDKMNTGWYYDACDEKIVKQYYDELNNYMDFDQMVRLAHYIIEEDKKI